MSWQPTISIENLKQRAQILAKIRAFFAAHEILEVETPLLSRGTITDPNIISLVTKIHGLSRKEVIFYLQTSPEFAMKRLLCAGSGPIYQICKAFRDGESGNRHNPEFTMLEWYRPGFSHHKLMQEVDLFLQEILVTQSAESFTYRDVFIKYLDIDPLAADINELQNCAAEQNLGDLQSLKEMNKDAWLNLLISHSIEPHLGQDRPTFIYDFPASQAALSKIRVDQFPVAERFELFIKGIEIANGFYELQNAAEQRQRFENDLKKREQMALESVAIDQYFLQALEAGLPDCSGVAIGLDRLMMVALKAQSISEVIALPISRA